MGENYYENFSAGMGRLVYDGHLVVELHDVEEAVVADDRLLGRRHHSGNTRKPAQLYTSSKGSMLRKR
jgi:hypothetical protein